MLKAHKLNRIFTNIDTMPKDPFTYKYRPKLLKDFQMNPELRGILNTLIAIEKLNILLTGNSGSGKTSLIHAIIREYYGRNIPLDHDNIMSINTLKEQGISYYRNEVRVFCQTSSCIEGKRKILILDDIDIINEQSQQVFRNCIDKYSNNVCFIASCCNTQKVIDSLQSRMDIIKIKPHTCEELSAIAKNIALKENIIYDENVLHFITKVCNGSVRILVNYLEKFKLMNSSINLDLSSRLCTNISFSELNSYTNACIENKLSDALLIISNLVQKGYSVTDVLDNYFTFIKHTEILNEQQKYKIIPFVCKYITIFHNIHEDEIELSFFTNNIVKLLAHN